MGGRGAWSHTAHRLRNHRRAVIRRSKISDYLLNPKKSEAKARFLHSLGYNMKNQTRLQRDLRAGLRKNRARVSEPNRHGRIHFQVNMEIGLNKKAKVVTGWYLDRGAKEPVFATLRPYRGTKDDF